MTTVAIDFDGVLHPYTAGWVGEIPADEPPTVGARAFLVTCDAARYRVVIFSCRAETEVGRQAIWRWLERHQLDALVDTVTHVKPTAVAYIDDRGVPFSRAGGGDEWVKAWQAVQLLVVGTVHGAPQPPPPEPVERPFVLDLASNPHPKMLARALTLRAEARAATEPTSEALWEAYQLCMCDATGEPVEAIGAWLDAHESTSA